MVKERNVVLVYLLMLITVGFYGLYWSASTKNEMNRLGAEIPTAWLAIIPIANIFWLYKYCDGFATHVKKDNNGLLWFLVGVIIGIILPAIVQSELNKYAGEVEVAVA